MLPEALAFVLRSVVTVGEKKKYTATNVYIRGGLIFLHQPSSDHIAWLQDGYEFEGPECVSHAPGKAKLGLRTAADIFWVIAKAGILRQHEFDIYQEAFYYTLRNNPVPPTVSDRHLPGWN